MYGLSPYTPEPKPWTPPQPKPPSVVKYLYLQGLAFCFGLVFSM